MRSTSKPTASPASYAVEREPRRTCRLAGSVGHRSDAIRRARMVKDAGRWIAALRLAGQPDSPSSKLDGVLHGGRCSSWSTSFTIQQAGWGSGTAALPV